MMLLPGGRWGQVSMMWRWRLSWIRHTLGLVLKEVVNLAGGSVVGQNGETLMKQMMYEQLYLWKWEPHISAHLVGHVQDH